MKDKDSMMGETDTATASTETETTEPFTEMTKIRFVQVTNFYYDPEETLETVTEEETEISGNLETVHNETITTDIDETVNEKETETNMQEIDLDVKINDEEIIQGSEENHSFEELSLDSTTNSTDNSVGKEDLITDIDDPDKAVETDINDTNGKCIDNNEKNSATKQSGDDKNSRDKEESSGKKKNKEKKSRKLKKSKSFVNQFRQCLPIGQGQR